jgi:CO dehydrogenase/acetyl-CoA synthase delta subunit
MKSLLNKIKTEIICRRTRTKMLAMYMSKKFYSFDDNYHSNSCIKCQVSGKRYKAFREIIDEKFEDIPEVPKDFASKVMDSLDKKVKTTTSKSKKIILLTLLGILSIVFLIFGLKRSNKKLENEQ